MVPNVTFFLGANVDVHVSPGFARLAAPAEYCRTLEPARLVANKKNNMSVYPHRDLRFAPLTEGSAAASAEAGIICSRNAAAPADTTGAAAAEAGTKAEA